MLEALGEKGVIEKKVGFYRDCRGRRGGSRVRWARGRAGGGIRTPSGAAPRGLVGGRRPRSEWEEAARTAGFRRAEASLPACSPLSRLPPQKLSQALPVRFQSPTRVGSFVSLF